MSNVFERLSAINVNDHIKEKDKQKYLPWAWAWAETKKVFPDANYKLVTVDYDEITGFMCHTEVTIESITHPMWLPVLDGANKSMKKESYTYMGTQWVNGKKIPIEKTVAAATTFDINKAIMRCLVKNLAMFGLGTYIYQGEDAPEEEAPKAAPEPVQLPTLTKKDENYSKVVSYVTDNKSKGIEAILKQLNRKYLITPAMQKEFEKIIG